MKTLKVDLRYSLRNLRKNPAYAAITILLLALGIGANSAIFSVAHSVLLRPLPYLHPEQLVVTLHQGNFPVSPADYLDYKKNARSFEQMGAAQLWGANLTAGDRPEHIPGIQVTANMMQLLGIAPRLGRSFLPEEEHAGASKVLLLSHDLWRDRFGADRNVVGREVLLDRVPYKVVGVMPPGFRFAPFWATRARMWTPLVLDARVDDRGGRSLRVFARLRPGVSIARAQSEMGALAKRLADRYPQTNAKLGISVVSLHEKVVRSVRPMLLVLLGTVGFVLLIACATISNLALARAVARRKEMALRLAIGAQGSDLIRLNLVEVLLLAALGGLAGVLLGNWAVALLIKTLPPESIPRQAEVGFDGMALLFAGAVTVLSVLFAGLVPSVQALQADLNADLKEGNRGSSQNAVGGSARSAFIAAEVALSLVLLAGAALMMRTMLALQVVDAGFNPHNLLTMQIAVSGTEYDQNHRRGNLFREVRNNLAAVPGIESVSAINHLPIGGDIWNLGYTIEGRPIPAPGEELSAVYRVIMPGYFRTMQIGLLQGRDFNEHDSEEAAGVAIINEAMAKRRWPGESPLGKSIHYGATPDEHKAAQTIIGVVRNVRQNDWTSPPADEIYLPYDQHPDAMGLSYLTFVLRTQHNPNQAADKILQSMSTFNKNLPIAEVAGMERVIANELWRQRLATELIGGFAGVAVLLAVVGIYGVVSYSMRQRTQEIGIRMALGAESSDLIGLALREGMKPVFMGALIGLVLALLLTRFMQTLLYGVTAADPLTFSVTVIALMAICVFANLIPALRAARVDPLIALRHD
ncbi:MAG: ABC transporter permease [Acidobacteriales bacterium]|nr:ABC transporter permease [Terriglobales bacterium]